MDDLSSRLANALLGNSEEAATLEFTIKGPTLTFAEPTTIAVAGANLMARPSYFLLPTSYFLLPTSYFLLPTS